MLASPADISLFSPQELIDHMLIVDVNRRYSAEQILMHPWIKVIMGNEILAGVY